jgi:hypothetical protein
MKTTRAAVRCALRIVVCLALAPESAIAQSVNYLVYTPSVVTPGATAPLLVEVELTAAATSVTIDFNPAGSASSSIALRDDGSEGDRAAGDRIYSGRLPVAPILAARTLDDVNRVFIGFLNVLNGSTATMRGNLFVDVYTSVMGVYPVSRLSQFVQATTRVVNIHDAGYFTSRNLSNVTREFYRYFPDNYDVLNIVFDPQRFENRTHFVVKNTVSGVGLSMTDSSATYGSGGRLTGISQFPISRLFDGVESGTLHELGHQWINFLRGAPFASGAPHWPYSSMASGIMGFSIGGTGGQGGNYPCTITEDPRGYLLTPRADTPVFNDIDLYLMGLLPANEVRTQFAFADQAAAPQVRCEGIFTGAMTPITINEIMAAGGGPRVPAYGQAPNNFTMATVLVTRNGLASPEMMSFYSWMAERAEWRTRVPTHSGFVKELGQPFYLATGRRGTLQMDIDLRRPDFAVTPGTPSVTVRAGTEALYEIAVFSRGSTLDAPVTLSCESLPANATCAFQSNTVTPGAGGQTTVMSISTATVAAGTHIVIVTGRNGDEKHSTAVTLIVQ